MPLRGRAGGGLLSSRSALCDRIPSASVGAAFGSHRHPVGRAASDGGRSLALPPPIEGTAEAGARVSRARQAQTDRGVGLNAVLTLEALEKVAKPDAPGLPLLLSKAA